MSVPRFIALRYLRPRRHDRFVSIIGLFSLLGITLGVATLIVVMAVMNGFRAELFKQILGLNGHISVYAAGSYLDDYPALVKRIEALPEVESALAQIEGQAMLTAGENASGVIVRGIAASDLNKRAILANSLRGNNVSAFAQPNTVIVGARLAERLGLTYGDSITLVAPKPSRTAFGLVPRYKTYSIADIFDVGMYEYDNNFIYMSLASAGRFFGVPEGKTQSLDVRLTDNNAVPAVADAILAAEGSSVLLRDWRQANSSFFQALQIERNVMFLILTLIILVAAFNIISSLIMLVKDKTRDIAVLRTMGASQRTIIRIFMLAGSSLGILGTSLGVALGVVIAVNIESVRAFLEKVTGTRLFPGDVYFLSQLPSKIELHEVLAVALMALVLSFLATLYPARKAARLDPVEALRHG